MPLTVLGLVFGTALVILIIALVSPHMRRRQLARREDCADAGDGGWNAGMFSSDGNADCGAGDAGGGCDGGGD